MWFSGFVLHQAQGIPWWRAPQQPTPWPRGSGSASHSAVHACACPPWGLHPAVVALSKTPIEAGRSERCVCSYTLKRKAWIFLSGTTRRVNTVSALPGKLEDWHWPCSFFRASIPGLSENRDLHWDQAGLNVPNKRGWYQCERVLTHAALGCAQGKHPHQQWPGGWRPLACAGGDQGETEMLSGRMSLLQGDWYICWTRPENSVRNFSLICTHL